MQGKLLELSLASIAEIDGGRIREAFAIALRRCQADCKDRPSLVDPRRIALHVTLTPVAGETGELESVRVQFHVVDAQPKRKSKVYDMRAEGGQLLWNELSPDDVRQMTLDQIRRPKEVGNAG